MNLSDLTGAQKGAFVFRCFSGAMLVTLTFILNAVWGSVTKTSDQISEQSKDIAQIKWELPTIKNTAIADKSEVLRQIDNLEKRMQSFRDAGDSDRNEMSKIRTDIALLKQKIQLP